jgi:hypothetical protein
MEGLPEWERWSMRATENSRLSAEGGQEGKIHNTKAEMTKEKNDKSHE